MASKFAQLEIEEGRPLNDVIIELSQLYESLGKIAVQLGITQSTLSIWLQNLGLEVQSSVVPKDIEIVIHLRQLAPDKYVLTLAGFEWLNQLRRESNGK